MTKVFMFLFTFALLVPVKLIGQTEINNKVVVCTFFYWGGDCEDTLNVKVGGHFFPIEFDRRSRSAPVSLQRREFIEIHRGGQLGVEGEPVYELLAQAPLPQNIKRALLLVVAPDGAGKQHRIVVLNDSLEAFPGSTFHFVNLSGNRLRVDFGGESKALGVDETIVLNSKVDQKGGFVPCAIYDADGEKHYENRLYSQRTARKLVLIGQSKIGGGMPAVGLLSELLPQKSTPIPRQ